MVKGTLPVWMAILIFGFTFAALFGFINHYVPKEQKEKAKMVKNDSSPGVDFFIEYNTRVSQLWYVFVGLVVSGASLIAFIMEDFDVIEEKIAASGAVGFFATIIILILALIFVTFLVTAIACLGETFAIEETKDHYWRAYGAIAQYPKRKDSLK